MTDHDTDTIIGKGADLMKEAVWEIERLRAKNERLPEAQPVPEGWRVDLEGTGHVVMRAPNGGFAVIGPPEHEEARLRVVSEFLTAMLAAAPKRPEGGA